MKVAQNLLPEAVGSNAAYLGNKVSHSLWHQRLGHQSNAVVSSMLSKSNIVSFPEQFNVVMFVSPV